MLTSIDCKPARLWLITATLLAALGLTAALLHALPAAAAPVQAAGTLIVNTADDTSDGSCSDGTCSLRDAITLAAPGDSITFAADYTIYLSNTLNLSRTVTLDGSEHAITVSGDTGHDGSPDVQVFAVSATGVVTLTHINIVSGTTNHSGGGGLFNAGRLVVQDSTFADNRAYQGGGLHNAGVITITGSTFINNLAYGGGGLFNSATATVASSTFYSNSASNAGGGLTNEGTLTTSNSTFSGNRSSIYGGGLANYGTVTIENSTFAANLSANGGGLAVVFGTVTLHNTLIANSLSGGDCWGDVAAASRFNLIQGTGASACNLTNGTNGNIIGQDPRLAALGDNGGHTQTHALLFGSPAIDAGDAAVCPATDQRGVTRPQGAHCDIGAFEKRLTAFLGKSVSPLTNVPYHGPVTYTLVISGIDSTAIANAYLTDTLPTTTDFAHWVRQPAGATFANNTLAWNGPLTAGTTLTFTFVATHTGTYNERVINTATLLSDTTATEAAQAAFQVECLNSLAVQNANDDGPGSLRRALNEVCPGGAISFAQDETIPLNRPLSLSGQVSIDGSGHAITVTGSGKNIQLFNVAASGVITLTHLSLVDGHYLNTGGGIYNQGTLTVRACTFTSNSAYQGGGLYNAGALTLQGSTFTHNAADQFGGGLYSSGSMTSTDNLFVTNTSTSGGGLYNAGAMIIASSLFNGNSSSGGGGVYNTSTLDLINSTFSDNRVTGFGGGLYNGGVLTLTNSTISSNTASYYGSGLFSLVNTITLRNTLLAGNANGGDCAATLNPSSHHNLIQSTGVDACGLADGVNGNLIGKDPLLGALQDNGGPTWTYALLPGSPALDAGDDATCPATDQRHYLRPGGAHCDIGAFEAGPSPITYTLTVNTAGNGSGNVTTVPTGTTFAYGTMVTLTATPASGSTFTGWGGDLSGQANPAVITIDRAKTITATFALNTYTLTVNTAGNGTGSVTTVPTGTTFAYGTVVTLTATPAPGSTFTGWSGDLSGQANPAVITMDSAKTITATFVSNRVYLPLSLR